MAKSIPGPTFKVDSPLPCGCKIAREEGTSKFRLWYCPTHAAAFEVLEALRFNHDALGSVLKQMPDGNGELDFARDAEFKARTVIRRATAGV